MYLSRTPYIARWIFPHLTWEVKGSAKTIYLTFDDGPDPGVTPDALELLDAYSAKATFFCVGEKVNHHTGLYKTILAKGHTTGNHTYHHLNGRMTTTPDYLDDVRKASMLINSRLFRPPYGRIRGEQVRELLKTHKIIMWSVLPGDFDIRRPKEAVLHYALRHTRNGSIVVLHDNAKFKEKMLYVLERFLRHFSQQGYAFQSLSYD